jgi:hypothetical protein
MVVSWQVANSQRAGHSANGAGGQRFADVHDIAFSRRDFPEVHVYEYE